MSSTEHSVKDKLTVVITTYNRTKQLDATLTFFESNPLLRECPFVVLNNQSTDNTAEVVEKHKQSFASLELVTHPVNVGANANYMHGFEHCHTDYLWIIADDDSYDFSEFDDVAAELVKGRADIIHVGAHNDGEWNWGVYETPKALIQKGYHYFKYSSFWGCSILKFSYFKQYAKEAFDFIHFSYPHFPYLIKAYNNDTPVYVSKKRIVTATVGVQSYSYYIPIRGFVMASSLTTTPEARRAVCKAVYNNCKPLWYNYITTCSRYRHEAEFVLVKYNIRRVMTVAEKLAAFALYIPISLYDKVQRHGK